MKGYPLRIRRPSAGFAILPDDDVTALVNELVME
jgi:hypothetical protein